jgi:hypothetical protein
MECKSAVIFQRGAVSAETTKLDAKWILGIRMENTYVQCTDAVQPKRCTEYHTTEVLSDFLVLESTLYGSSCRVSTEYGTWYCTVTRWKYIQWTNQDNPRSLFLTSCQEGMYMVIRPYFHPRFSKTS